MSMRITDSYMASILLGDLNRSLGNMLEQQRMAGSQKRLSSFADDPRAIGTINRYNALIANNDDYLSNVSKSRVIVDATDVALQSVSEVLSRARELALRESSAVTDNDAAVEDVRSLVDRLMDVLNTDVEGNYIFSGRQVFTPPFIRSGDTVLYQGDDGQIESRTGPSSTTTVNLPGTVFMGNSSATLGGRVDVAPAVTGATLLADLNLGNGWKAGSISITNGTGAVWEVDLAGATTVADVMNAISATTGGAVSAAVQTDGKGLVLTGTGPLVVAEVSGGGTAASLGLQGTSSGGTLTGRDVRAGADDATLLADVKAFAGKLPLGTMSITWQGTTHSIDLSGAATLGDVRTTIAAAVPGMELQVRDSSLVLVGGSTAGFTVANADGTNTASVLGLAGEGGPTRLFGMLEDLMASLAAGDKDAIRGAASEIASLEDMIQRLMIRNGGRQNDLDWSEGVLRQRDERLRSNLSLETDVDVAQVASDLSRAETTYQASLLVASKLYQTNLMQYLR